MCRYNYNTTSVSRTSIQAVLSIKYRQQAVHHADSFCNCR